MASYTTVCLLLFLSCGEISADTHQDRPARFVVSNYDYEWTPFGPFQACSETCGDGFQRRYRKCVDIVTRQHVDSRKCYGDFVDIAPCYVQPCDGTYPWATWAPWGFVGPVDGQWGPWSAPSACSKSCGPGGTTRRHRSCDSPPPSDGGAVCQGYAYRFSPCSTNTACTVNGGWSSWSGWSTCSASCDVGHITRARSCTNPAPSGGGTQCNGDGQETHDCSLGPCATWSHWFDAPCSVTCGTGTRERLRQCNTGRNQDCAGQSYILETCNGPACIASIN